jgi:putative lipoic acid-binding regulatory protein
MTETHKTSLIDYPSDFPIKVMGKQDPALAQTLTDVVTEHDPNFDPSTVEIRMSKAGNYVGLTFTVKATSREQLDALYQALHAHPMVSVVL